MQETVEDEVRSHPLGAAERVVLERFIVDFSAELGDQAGVDASLGRAINLYRRADCTLSRFTQLLYEARGKAKAWAIDKAKPDGGRNRMPYFFACLEQSLGRHR